MPSSPEAARRTPSHSAPYTVLPSHLAPPHPLFFFALAEDARKRSERLAEAAGAEASLAAELSSAKASLRPLQLALERVSDEKELAVKSKRWFEGEHHCVG